MEQGGREDESRNRKEKEGERVGEKEGRKGVGEERKKGKTEGIMTTEKKAEMGRKGVRGKTSERKEEREDEGSREKDDRHWAA